MIFSWLKFKFSTKLNFKLVEKFVIRIKVAHFWQKKNLLKNWHLKTFLDCNLSISNNQ